MAAQNAIPPEVRPVALGSVENEDDEDGSESDSSTENEPRDASDRRLPPAGSADGFKQAVRAATGPAGQMWSSDRLTKVGSSDAVVNTGPTASEEVEFMSMDAGAIRGEGRALTRRYHSVKGRSSTAAVSEGADSANRSSFFGPSRLGSPVNIGAMVASSRMIAGSFISVAKEALERLPDAIANDGWSGGPYVKGSVTTRTKGRRTIFLYRPYDLLLFDQVSMWKAKFPSKTRDQAWDFFNPTFAVPGRLSQVDAMIKLHYGVERYDYVLKFRSSANPRPEATRKALEKKLLQRGLIVEREQSLEEPKDYYVKIVAPFHVLCAKAQYLKLKLPLKRDEAYCSMLKEERTISIDRLHRFTKLISHFMPAGEARDSYQHQSANFKRKNLSQFEGGDQTERKPREIQTHFFRDSHRSLLTYHIIAGEEVWIKSITGKRERKEGIQYLVNESIYTSIFHLHDDEQGMNMRSFLETSWVQQYYKFQPLDEIASYFGEKVGMYFAFVGFYNRWLMLASAAGVLVTLYGILTLQHTDDGDYDWTRLIDNELTPWFSFLISLWAIIMPSVWKRQANHLAWRWSTMASEKEETRRPQFKAEMTRRSPITGKQELYFQPQRRMRRQLMSALVMFVWVLAICFTIAGQVSFGAYMSTVIQNESLVSLITASIGLLSIVLMKLPFGYAVEALNEWENYRTESVYDDAIVLKSYIFDFSNNYSQLLYFAIVRPNMMTKYIFGSSFLPDDCGGDTRDSTCTKGIFINLVIIFIGGQIVERCQELAIPWIRARWSVVNAESRVRSRQKVVKVQKDLQKSEQNLGVKELHAPSASAATVIATAPISPSSDAPSPPQLPQTPAINPPPPAITSLETPIFSLTSESTGDIGGVKILVGGSSTSVMTPAVVPSGPDPSVRAEKSLTLSASTLHMPARARGGIANASAPLLSEIRPQLSTINSVDSREPSVVKPPENLSQNNVLLLVGGPEVQMRTLSTLTPDEYCANLDMFEAMAKVRLPQYYRDDKLNPHPGIRDEFSQKVLQFGFLALFVCPFPLAPVFALLNNIYEIRADAFKLLNIYQRTLPVRTQDIGVWEHILRFVGVLAVATNSITVAFTSKAFEGLLLSGVLEEGARMGVRVGFVLAFHYAAYLFSTLFRMLIPEVPKGVMTAMARASHLQRLLRDNDVEEEEGERLEADDDD